MHADSVNIAGVNTGSGLVSYAQGNCTVRKVRLQCQNHLQRTATGAGHWCGNWQLFGWKKLHTDDVVMSRCVAGQDPDAGPPMVGDACSKVNSISVPMQTVYWTCGIAVKGDYACGGGTLTGSSLSIKAVARDRLINLQLRVQHVHAIVLGLSQS